MLPDGTEAAYFQTVVAGFMCDDCFLCVTKSVQLDQISDSEAERENDI